MVPYLGPTTIVVLYAPGFEWTGSSVTPSRPTRAELPPGLSLSVHSSVDTGKFSCALKPAVQIYCIYQERVLISPAEISTMCDRHSVC